MRRKILARSIASICLGLAMLGLFTGAIALSTRLAASPEKIAHNYTNNNYTASPKKTVTPTEIRGVWLTNVASGVLFAPWGVNRALHQLAELNFNTVYPVVWNRGNTFYPSSVSGQVTGSSQEPLLKLMRLGGDVLNEIIEASDREGLRVIPWFEYGLMAPASSELAKRHPDWLARTREGFSKENTSSNLPQLFRNPSLNRPIWLNPLHPQVQQFILDLILEVVVKYDIDGIQLDDHFGMPVEFGYDPWTVKLYQQEHNGRRPPKNYKNAKWMRWRADKITDFMEQIVRAVKAAKPDCLVSVSPNSQEYSYQKYLQDWLAWVEKGLADELILQVYRDDPSSFEAELDRSAALLARRKIPVGIGLLSGTLLKPVDMARLQKQVLKARDRHFDGVSFFYWESLWGYIAPESPSQRRRAFQELFDEPAIMP